MCACYFGGRRGGGKEEKEGSEAWTTSFMLGTASSVKMPFSFIILMMYIKREGGREEVIQVFLLISNHMYVLNNYVRVFPAAKLTIWTEEIYTSQTTLSLFRCSKVP